MHLRESQDFRECAAFLFAEDDMPDPNDYEKEDDWMAACVPMRIDEGDEQEQAVAAGMNMWRGKKNNQN